jgi:ADP-heptose:LPS heptosyltransferase
MKTVPYYMYEYAPLQYLKLLEAIGISTKNTKKILGHTPEAKEKAISLLRNFRTEGKLLIGISPSAGNKIKCWAPQNFARVADLITKKHNATFVIVGTKQDQAEVEEMVKALSPGTQHLNTCGQLSIDELKALISELDLFISVDSGPIYIAEAFGVPTVDIVGPMDEREQPPKGEKNRNVFLPNRTPELHIMNARDYNVQEARRQIEEITPEMVIKEVDYLFP